MKRLLPALATALLGSLPACNEPTTGTLSVTYKLGPGDATACADFDIVEMRGILGEEDFDATAPCGEPLDFGKVAVGKWDLRVEAVDSEGFVVMDNGGTSDQVEILGDANGTYESQLTASPVNVFVRWSINVNDFQAQCNDPAVTTAQFDVATWDDLPTMLTAENFACDDPADMGSYRRVDDSDRQIKGNLLKEVSVRPLDSSGASLGPTARFILDAPPGPGRNVYVTVECSDNMCVAAGAPPYAEP